MRRVRVKAFIAAMLLACMALMLGCTGPSNPLNQQPAAEAGGCNPQVASGYRVLASVPVGIMEIRVKDASGSPQASVSLTATRLVPTGAKCMSMISGVTDAQGLLRLERMKTGPYQVSLDAATATASVEVEADKTAMVTLVN